MTSASKPPVTVGQVFTMSAFYAVILVVSVKFGYGVGLCVLAVAVAVNFRTLGRLVKRYLWDQWLIINAESMDPAFLGPGRASGQASGAGRAAAPKGRGRGRRKGAAAGAGAGVSATVPATATATATADPAGWRLDYRPLVVLIFAAVTLTLLEYWGGRKIYHEIAPKFFPYAEGRFFKDMGVSWFGLEYQRFGEYVYWVGFRLGAFFILPALFIVCLPGERVRDYGLSTKGFIKHLPVYGILFLIVLPAVIAVSYTDAFASHYPFYKPWRSFVAPRGLYMRDFLAWEAIYAVQFFALEFFFRGFFLHALKRSIGAYAIFVMAVPYCMIHFGKPMPETLGAIAAGIVLGTLSLRTGSIWAGVLIHVSVAWSMDWLALIQTGRVPKVW